MTYTITPLPALSDNYIWLIASRGRAVCIDPGAAEPVLAYLQQHSLQLEHIWITHHHGDHTAGIAELAAAFPQCRVSGGSDIAAADDTVGEGSLIVWQGFTAEVWHTPGHTAGHLCYLFDKRRHVFTGDTLFSAGCGRVFPDSRPEWLYTSLTRLAALPDSTLLYPAHEYTAANLRFAAHIEPDNPHIIAAQQRAQTIPTLPVTLAREKQTNPFLRVHLPAVQQRIRQLTQQTYDSDENYFVALRELKNRFQNVAK